MRDLKADLARLAQLEAYRDGAYYSRGDRQKEIDTLCRAILPEAIERALTAEAEVEARGKVIAAHHGEMLRRIGQVDELKAEVERLKGALRLMLDAHPNSCVTANLGRCRICERMTSSGMIHTCPDCADKAARAALEAPHA
jgi:hypothetical protein